MAERLSSLEDEQIQRNATWARRFMGTAENQGAPRNEYERLQQDQNDSRRRLYKNEIDDAVARDKARTEEEFEALQIRNPAVGRLMLAREQADRAAEENRLKRNLENQKLEWSKEKERIGNEINKIRAERDLAQQKRLLNDALIKEKNDLRRDQQTYAAQQYIQGMAEKGQLPGSDEFAYGAAEVMRQNPYIEDDLRDRLVEDMKLIEDPREAAAAAARGDRVTRTQGPDGKPRYTYVSTPEKADDGKADLYRDRSYAVSERNALLKMMPDKKDPRYEDMKRQVDEFSQRVRDVDAKIQAFGKPKQEATPPVAEQPKSVPPTGLGVGMGGRARGTLAQVNADEEKAKATSTPPPAQPTPDLKRNKDGAIEFSSRDEAVSYFKNAKPGDRIQFGGKTYVKD